MNEMRLQNMWAFVITRLGAPTGIDAALAGLAKGETDAAGSVYY